jgi:hypothetical protein
MNPLGWFADVCFHPDGGLADALACLPDPQVETGLVVALVVIGPLIVAIFFPWRQPLGSRRHDALLTADRITRLKARIVEEGPSNGTSSASARCGFSFGTVGAHGGSAANTPSRPIPRAGGAATHCRWLHQGWRPGTRLARWTCSTCGAEASSLHERHPPVHCRGNARS